MNDPITEQRWGCPCFVFAFLWLWFLWSLTLAVYLRGWPLWADGLAGLGMTVDTVMLVVFVTCA